MSSGTQVIAPANVESTRNVTAKDSSKFYARELDVLRFFAFLLIFAHHSLPSGGMMTVVKNGSALGVPLFFLLSAYLISTLALKERRDFGSLKISWFYLRRVLRIWPLYFTVLGFTYLLGVFHLAPRMPLGGLTAYLLLAGNWWSAFHGFLPSLAGPLWSITVEEQFYLIWPFLLTRSPRTIAFFCGAIWLFSQIYIFALTERHNIISDRLWTDSLVHAQFFALGTLLCLFVQRRRYSPTTSIRVLLGAAGLGSLLLAAKLLGSPDPTRFMSSGPATLGYMVTGVGVCLLFLSALHARMPNWTRWMGELGKRSYGLYVFHLGLIELTVWCATRMHYRHSKFLLVIGITFPVLVAVAFLSYALLEKPFLRYKRHFERVHSRPA